jgi:hypothetical protein
MTTENVRTRNFALFAASFTDSLTWALVIALVPVVYADRDIVPQVVMTFAYIWQLSWVGVLVWDLTNADDATRQNRKKIYQVC